MKNYVESVEINPNQNWPYVLNHPHRILIIGGSGSGKSNVLLNLIKHQRPSIDKFIFMSKIRLNKSMDCLSAEEKK